jgi:hypothetical protein
VCEIKVGLLELLNTTCFEHVSIFREKKLSLSPIASDMPQVVESYKEALNACQTHGAVVGLSGGFFGFYFSYLRFRQKYPDLLKRNKTVLPALAGKEYPGSDQHLVWHC